MNQAYAAALQARDEEEAANSTAHRRRRIRVAKRADQRVILGSVPGLSRVLPN